ncbi:MAG TPA: hypothetical protein VHA33_16775 [Candidatus Angelobacter sp.]|jgi:hypothetical protein|nr:hypothetical protein [Candidatus Angelobacter sp.]
MLRRIIFFLFTVVTAAVFGQGNSRLPDNKELVNRAKSFYIHSDTFFMKREQLESSMLGRAEFKAWDIQITNKKDLADLLVRVRRIPFTNHFSYTVTDRVTETVVMAGQVDSLAGTVHGLIADEIVHKMKVFRGDPLQQQKPQAQPNAPAKPNGLDM